MNDYQKRAFEAEKYMISHEEGMKLTSILPDEAIQIICDNEDERVPTGFAKLPNGQIVILVTCGQGPIIVWESKI